MTDDGNPYEPLIYDSVSWHSVDERPIENVHFLPSTRASAGVGTKPTSELRGPVEPHDTDLWARYILAACNNPIINHLLEDATAGVGCTLTTSDHVDAMLRCAAHCDGQASLMVVTLARGQGAQYLIEALEQLRSDNPELPVLVMADRPSMAKDKHKLPAICDYALPLPATPQRVQNGLHMAILNSEERIAV